MSGALFPVLSESGFQYGGTILNLPSQLASELYRQNRLHDSTAPLESSDLILLATRPPLDDMRKEFELRSKRRLLPSEHALEQEILRSLRSVFSKCDRETIRLADSVRLAENDCLREVHFHQSKGGSVRHYSVSGKRVAADPKNTTLGYLISIRSEKPRVPRILAAFGPGGTETLIFGYLLREEPRLRKLLQQMIAGNQSRVVVCTFLVPVQVPYPFLKYDVDELDLNVGVDQPLATSGAMGLGLRFERAFDD
jgi:hypothetical protein